MKIGIITFHTSHNYGAFLQAFALCNRLNQENGFEAEIIDYRMPCVESIYRPDRFVGKRFWEISYYKKRFQMFSKEYSKLPVSDYCIISDQVSDFQNGVKNKYDVILAGSDEIWRLGTVRGFPNAYWLPGDLNARKVAYAASSRSDFSVLNATKKAEMKAILAEFEIIGVRDDSTYLEIQKYTDSGKVLKCCDPVFVYNFKIDPQKGREILVTRFGVKPNKRVIGFMGKSDKIVGALKREFGRGVELVSLYETNLRTHTLSDLTPFEWINVISALDYLVSFYFHGVCFALKSNVPFSIIDNRSCNIESSKLNSLMLDIGIDKKPYMGVTEALGDERFLREVREGLNSAERPDYRALVKAYSDQFDNFVSRLRKKGPILHAD